MKKAFAFTLAVLLAFGLAACGASAAMTLLSLQEDMNPVLRGVG